MAPPRHGGAPSRWTACAALAALALLPAGCGRGRPGAADLGDLTLESGEVLRGCRIAYRTFGTLDARRSNAVLLLPWFMGRSGELAGHVGPAGLVDSSRFFVIAVDAVGAGTSTSPSTSAAQPGAAFPAYTLRDLVEAERRLLEEALGIHHLHAVVGTSMGGMRALQWLTAHPGFADRAVVVAGSPRLSPAEAARWRAEAAAVLAEPAWRRAWRALAAGELRGAWRALREDPLDHARQAEALASTDVTAPFGGSLEAAAAAVRARLLVAVPARDPVVDPAPALDFARLTGAERLTLDGRCGHDAPSCERRVLWPAARRFLAD